MADSNSFYASSKSNEHYTPEWLMELVRGFLSGIDLDPASCETANRTVKAKEYYTKEQNGLTKTWKSRNIFLNPPGGRIDRRSSQDVWLGKAINEWLLNNFEEGIVLVTASTADLWFRQAWDFPILFLRGRLNFIDENGVYQQHGDTKSRCLVYLPAGSLRTYAFSKHFEQYGQFVNVGYALNKKIMLY